MTIKSRKSAFPAWSRFWRSRGANVALLFAICLLPLVATVTAAVDMSRLADGRASLQRAADNGALSGASAYALNSSTYNTLALTMATASYCNQAITIPEGFTLVAASTAGGLTAESCGTKTGPSVGAVTGGYARGTPGIDPNSGCTVTNTAPASGDTCGFIVTVRASATMNTSLPFFFGASRTITVTGVAENPFLNIAGSIRAKILGSAYNTNSVWLYPLLLNANGQPDFTTNQGALPGISGTSYPEDAAASSALNPNPCTDSPSQTACGPYTMLADTAFAGASTICPTPTTGCTPFGATGANFVNGVVMNPTAPTAVITATTPIGIAFESVAGGGSSYGFPGLGFPNGTAYPGGYSTSPASNGCLYPGNGVYTTVVQYFNNFTSGTQLYGTPSNGSPALAWPLVTHWFYSSYLLNGDAPSQGEIFSQLYGLSSYYDSALNKTIQYNTDVPSIGSNNVSGHQNSFYPTLISCDPNLALNPVTPTNTDELLVSSYPTTGATNASLYITSQATGSAYVAPASTGFSYVRYTPAATPGYQYAGLSCQSYGNNIFTFYWNDMGGSQGFGDDLDYNNGTVQITCSGPAFVVLIQ